MKEWNFSVHDTVKYLEKFDDLFLTADFSHWSCVSESYLENQKDALNFAISRTKHIHARIGFPEGPQVTHPGAPEWAEALNTHLLWWNEIINLNKSKGEKIFTITPEFGPRPYLPTMPFTNKPLAEQWDLNIYMKELLDARYNK